MKISEIIEKIIDYHYGKDRNGAEIDPTSTRDRVLFGDPEKDCTGIATCCWASIEVIQKAIRLNVNLIICHEAMFWNRGDQTKWLTENNNVVFEKKRQLLEEHGIVVWRNHDYVHSGIPVEENIFKDGIFWGISQTLGWENEIMMSGEPRRPVFYSIRPIMLKKLVVDLIRVFDVNGARFIGNPKTTISKVYFCSHISGEGERQLINFIEKESIDLLITFELVDFTVSEYIKDCEILGRNRALISLGHFNTEEIAMKYMLSYLNYILEDRIPCFYIPAGDMYHYVINED